MPEYQRNIPNSRSGASLDRVVDEVILADPRNLPLSTKILQHGDSLILGGPWWWWPVRNPEVHALGCADLSERSS